MLKKYMWYNREKNTISLNQYISNSDKYNDISNLNIIDSEISLSENEDLSKDSESDENDETISERTLFDITATDKILEKYSQNVPVLKSKKLLPSIPSMYFDRLSLITIKITNWWW